MMDILGKYAIYSWISWVNEQFIMVDMLSKCTIFHDGYLGQMCNLLMDFLGKCAFYHGGYLEQMYNLP